LYIILTFSICADADHWLIKTYCRCDFRAAKEKAKAKDAAKKAQKVII